MQFCPSGRVAKCKAGRLTGWAVLGLAILIAQALTAAPAPGAVHRQTITFSESQLAFTRSGDYDLISLEGARWLRQAGKPLLPAVPLAIGLEARRIVGVQAAAAESLVIAGTFSVKPSQPPRPISAPSAAGLVAPDAATYASADPYPARLVELVGTGELAGTKVCELLVCPLRYTPAAGRLVLYTSIEITVEYEESFFAGGPGGSGELRTLAERLVGSQSGPWRKSRKAVADITPLGAGEVAYLIITSDALKEAFEPLKEWKTRKGLPCEIVTVETVAGSYAGVDLQEKIRACIKHFNTVSGTDWVLLGGDVGVVPSRQAYVPLSDRPYIPCDLYYSDLDGTWNADGDPLWGEVTSDQVDMYADVFVGRAPVETADEAAAFVSKVLTYEGRYAVPTDYQLKMVFLAEVLWGDPGNPSDPEYTDAGIAKDLVQERYVPGTFSVEKLYQSAGTLFKADAIDALKEGAGVVNICCHGHYGSISANDDALEAQDFLDLEAGSRYGLMYSASCFGGGFDQVIDCIGEAWVQSPGGGGYYIGNSRYGWDTPGEPGDGPSDYYDQAFFESVFTTGFRQVGKAHADAKHGLVGEARVDPYMRYLMYGLNLLGDPETSLWTSTPVALQVAYPVAIGLEPVSCQVGVSIEGSPVEGARVCLWKTGEIYASAETGSDGTAALVVDAWSPGSLLVTVTAPGALPYLGETAVEECVSVPDGDRSGLFALSVVPNPFRGSVSLALEAAGDAPVVSVFDADGRWIAGLDARRAAGGRFEAEWNGEDWSGRRCSPGVYFLKVKSETLERGRKLVMLR